MLYRCELIEKGIVIKLFLWTADSVREIKEGLKLFQRPGEEWTISEAEDEN